MKGWIVVWMNGFKCLSFSWGLIKKTQSIFSGLKSSILTFSFCKATITSDRSKANSGTDESKKEKKRGLSKNMTITFIMI